MAGKELPEESQSSSPAAVSESYLSTRIKDPMISTEAPSGSSSVEALGDGGERTCDNVNETSDNGYEPEKTLKLADELTDKGRTALKENDFADAVDCFSRALEIRVAHFGELSPECMTAYYQYGKSLLYKAQEEADPIGAVPKKEACDSKQCSSNVDGVTVVNEESYSASASSKIEEEDCAPPEESVPGEEESSDSEENEDLANPDDDEPDLDLAWKMLDVARAISEKHAIETMEKVDILSALAEVALEREDIETSLSDYQKALEILLRIVEPDSRYLAELYFRICLCLEIGYNTDEAVVYCKRALSVCQSRMQRLTNETRASGNGSSVPEIDSEIETLKGLTEELEKKLEDLQQLVLNPKSILSEILASSKGTSNARASPDVMNSSQMASENSGGFDSPTVSTAHTNGTTPIMHLGVVGRGVKRVATSLATSESNLSKKPLVGPSSETGDDKN